MVEVNQCGLKPLLIAAIISLRAKKGGSLIVVNTVDLPSESIEIGTDLRTYKAGRTGYEQFFRFQFRYSQLRCEIVDHGHGENAPCPQIRRLELRRSSTLVKACPLPRLLTLPHRQERLLLFEQRTT